MKKITSTSLPLLFIIVLCFFSCSAQQEERDPKVLVFSLTKGYRHQSIAKGVATLEQLGARNGFRVVATEDPEMFNAANLRTYSAVVFLNTTGSFFDEEQKKAFQDFIRNGGGFLGVHAATDTFYDWPWYGQMIGAYFKSHPKVQSALIKVTDSSHLSTQGLPSSWEHRDEWYNFKAIRPSIRVVMELDEHSYQGGENGNFHPIAWYQNFEGGRVFYTALGHTEESYESERFLKHLTGALKWVIGR